MAEPCPNCARLEAELAEEREEKARILDMLADTLDAITPKQETGGGGGGIE